jgi:hypothetical protein
MTKDFKKFAFYFGVGIFFYLASFFFPNGISAENATDEKLNIDSVEPTPWRTQDDTIDGWDWSLPPAVKPIPYSGVKYPNESKITIPGNRLYFFRTSWKELEPEEGVYKFDDLRKRIEDVPSGFAGLDFHLYASVYEVKPTAAEDLERTGPAWLVDQHHVGLIEEKSKTNVAKPFQVINFNIYDPKYHERYLKFLKALGESGIPQMKQIMNVYVHGLSSSRGEETDETVNKPENLTIWKERLAATAQAFKGVEYKLEWVGSENESIMKYVYELGMGQRSGFVEMYMLHCNNPLLGQIVDKEGYLTVDESLPPIAEGRAFGDENEEYTSFFIPRFGPVETWSHRYRESMLRVLEMRRNFMWTNINALIPDLSLLGYVSLELGRKVENTPDVWCYLRESYVQKQNGYTGPVKNYERWLYQRDRENSSTIPAVKVDQMASMRGPPPGKKYDFIAHKTDIASGNSKIGFAMDDRFLQGGPFQVAVKITYQDIGKGKWSLVYKTKDGENSKNLTCEDSKKAKTATFFLDDAYFPAEKMDDDFEIRADEGDATISFVRVIKL